MADTVVNDFNVWDQNAPLVGLNYSREFETWTEEGGLLLDIDESDILAVRRRVAIF